MVWYAHSKRDYGTPRAEAGRLALLSLFPGAQLLDPSRVVWEPGLAERTIPRCGAVGVLPREPMALGVRREIELAAAHGVPVVDLGPFLALPQRLDVPWDADLRPLAMQDRPIPRPIRPMHQDKYAYYFGIYRVEYETPEGGTMPEAYAQIHPVGDGCTVSLATFQSQAEAVGLPPGQAGGAGVGYQIWNGVHVARDTVLQGQSEPPWSFWYSLSVDWDEAEYSDTSEEGEIGTDPGVHVWWPGLLS